MTSRSRSKKRAITRLRMGAAGSVFATRPPLDALAFASDAADLPGLNMPEPEDRRRILISSAMSALLHLLVISGIATLGYLAKQAVEEVIPVVILNQPIKLPGAKEPTPLPIPKTLAAPMASAIALAMRPSDLAAVPAPAVVEASGLDLDAPTSLDLAEVLGVPLTAEAAIGTSVSAAELVAPKVELSGPRETTIRTTPDLGAPRAFDSLSELNATRYKGAAVAPPLAAGLDVGDRGGDLVATAISADYITEELGGGDPNTVASGPCLQSAFVKHYLEEIKRRTYARWEPPLDASPDDIVQFRIALDHSGSIARFELIKSSSEPFAESAMAAYRSAAPFPPLNDDNRCLTEKTFRLTFRNPERP